MAAMFCLACVDCTAEHGRGSPLCAHLNSDDNLLAVKPTETSLFPEVWIILISALNAGICTGAQVYAITHKYSIGALLDLVWHRENELMNKELPY